MAGIYWNETEGIISLSSDGETWITIADKNLGATEVYEDGDTLSEANGGKFYQWGNNYGFPFTGPEHTSRTQVSVSGEYGPSNYYDSNVFVYNITSWSYGGNSDLWGGATNTLVARKGPCDTGYHVPSNNELVSLVNVMKALGIIDNSGNVNNSLIKQYLKMPFPGNITYSSATHENQGNIIYLWSSDIHSDDYTQAYVLYFYNNKAYNSFYYNASGFSVRPFANIPVVPDYNDTWETLYGDELPDRPIPPEPPKPKLKWFIKGVNYYYFGERPTHTSGITLNKSSITLNNAGDTEQLTATVTPDDAVNKKVLWSSSDETIATVSSTGLVTCVEPGECTITATCADGGASTTCSVSKPMLVDFLLVGGGGSGGGVYNTYGQMPGGGGGGGGVIYCKNYNIIYGNYCVIIGQGGTYVNIGQGSSGGDSCFGELIAYGGGAGGGGGGDGCNGGSGGGGGGGGGKKGYGYEGQGYDGYDGADPTSGPAGGGGGAGGSATGSQGGAGFGSDVTGSLQYYGGGGGGDWPRCSCQGATYCCYGGGGNGRFCNQIGENGYQGTFILRYPTDCGYDISGGCKYTCGDYTIHCFTSDGTLKIMDGTEWQPGINTVGYWPFNSTTQLTDQSGNNNTLTEDDGSAPAIEFNALGGTFASTYYWQHLYTPFIINNTDDYTFWYWYKKGSGTEIQFEGEGNALYLGIGDNNQYLAIYRDGTNSNSTNQIFTDSSVWYFVVLTKDTANKKFKGYVNGQFIYEVSYGNELTTDNRLSTKGRYGVKLSDMGLEKKLWTAEEISKYFNDYKYLYGY